MSTSATNPLSPPTIPTVGSASTTSAASTASEQSAIDALANPDAFLHLLVAQLQYQDPESPADCTAFVTQLATFAGVEQQAQMRTDLDSINTVAETFAVSASTRPSPSTTPAASDSTTSN